MQTLWPPPPLSLVFHEEIGSSVLLFRAKNGRCSRRKGLSVKKKTLLCRAYKCFQSGKRGPSAGKARPVLVEEGFRCSGKAVLGFVVLILFFSVNRCVGWSEFAEGDRTLKALIEMVTQRKVHFFILFFKGMQQIANIFYYFRTSVFEISRKNSIFHIFFYMYIVHSLRKFIIGCPKLMGSLL